MEIYNTEEEQIDAIKKWWQENGKSALFGIILGLGAIFGWRGWQAHVTEQAESASEIYQSAMVAMNQDDRRAARESAGEIITSYGNSGYAVFARLLLAYIETSESNYDAAEEHLRVALEETGNETLKHEINLRLARVYVSNNKYEQALSLLDTDYSENFASQYNELRGDINALQGKNEEARLAYQQALTEAEGSAYDTSLLNIKLNALQ